MYKIYEEVIKDQLLSIGGLDRNVYLTIPSKDKEIIYYELMKLIEMIGKQNKTIPRASDFKNGICYIQKKTACPYKRQIKLVLHNMKHVSYRNKDDVNYVFKCSIDYYVNIIFILAESMSVTKGDSLSIPHVIIKETMEGLKFVADNGMSDRKSIAVRMYDNLTRIT